MNHTDIPAQIIIRYSIFFSLVFTITFRLDVSLEMEFFSSLAKTEQKEFSTMTMDYAGPSKEHMHVGCLAGALWRCAEADKKAEDADDADVDEYREKEHFFFTHNGVSYPLRATLQEIGFDEHEEPRLAIKTEVRCKMAWGCVNWMPATRVYVEEHDNQEQAFWVSAEKLLPKLKAMIKCAGCKCDIIERIQVINPDGTTFPGQHCATCTTRQWDEPCTKCGHYIGARAPSGVLNLYNPYCSRCE